MAETEAQDPQASISIDQAVAERKQERAQEAAAPEAEPAEPVAPEETKETTASESEAPSSETASEGPTEAIEAEPETEPEAEASEGVEETEEAEGEAETEVEPEEIPAIDPPSSMNAADRQMFATLPPEAQEFVARRESEFAEGFTRKSQELAESRSQHQHELGQAQEAARTAIATQDRQYQEALQILGAQAQSLIQVYTPEQIEQLKQSDPAQAALAAEHNRQVREHQQAVSARVFQEQQAREQQAQQARERILDENRRKLPQLIPEWADAEKARTEGAQLSTYLTSKAGFTAQEVNGASDARLMVLARKAMLYDDLQASKPAITKKVRQAPKVVKTTSGDRKTTAEADLEHYERRIQNKGSISIRDAVQLRQKQRRARG